ncbi:MAG: hypothetical protein B7Y43_02250 [Sphingomonas sp. 28-62-20]|uniref:hypothetical protein n=1 Tax=Sphingomonas sp. 28-62-20 TaxID=1970433 RepID=UPI000BDDD459|nr:MAG: hypothetical protein B7Y43_02250 [Sphingomonas sp. 28-62-20]
MKSAITAAALAVAIITLAACARSPESATVDNGSEIITSNMAMMADNMEERAESVSDAMAANMMASDENAMEMGADDATSAADGADPSNSTRKR